MALPRQSRRAAGPKSESSMHAVPRCSCVLWLNFSIRPRLVLNVSHERDISPNTCAVVVDLTKVR